MFTALHLGSPKNVSRMALQRHSVMLMINDFAVSRDLR